MHSTPVRVACLVLLLLLMHGTEASARQFQSVDVESLGLTVDPEWASSGTPGYFPVRFDITNRGEARVIEIVGEGMRFFTGPRGGLRNGIAIRQTVRLGRGDRVKLTIPVPVYADHESLRMEVRENGRVLELFNLSGIASRSRPDQASVLFVADPRTALGEAATRWTRTTAALYPGGPVVSMGGAPLLDYWLTPERLPANWLGYTTLRAVMIGPAEWEQLTDAQKAALRTWTACGGDLLFVNGTFAAFLGTAPQSEAAPIRAYFLGRVHLPSAASIGSAGFPDLLARVSSVKDANWALPANSAANWGVIAQRGFRLPIPGVGGVPARAYFLLLVAFSIVIGPVNYWLLRRQRRLVLLVLTTPLISAICILLLGGYVLAGEGLGVRGRAVTFTMLDQVRRQAATRASVSLYAGGMAPFGGLSFARDEAVFPIGPEGNGPRDPQTIDLTEAQQFVDGVLQTRSPTNLETINFRPARERVGFDRDGGRVRAVNALGVTIRALFYREGDAVYGLDSPLAAGQKVVLTPGARRGAGLVPAGLPVSERLEHLIDHLPEHSYVAILERSPFWNAGVPKVDERGSFHVVMGWVDGQP